MVFHIVQQVLQLNAGSQRSTIDNLKEKAKSLKDTTSDSQLTEDTQIVVDRYDKLLADVKVSLRYTIWVSVQASFVMYWTWFETFLTNLHATII